MVRRSRLEMCFDVLEVVDNGTDKLTRIMYETNLSWDSLWGVFDTLINSDFIREVKRTSSKRYYITEKGKNALYYHVKSLDGFIQNE